MNTFMRQWLDVYQHALACNTKLAREWNLPHTVKMLGTARRQALDLDLKLSLMRSK